MEKRGISGWKECTQGTTGEKRGTSEISAAK
jgi:hypothetical protein